MKQREAISNHLNPIEYIQCTEFLTTPVVFISGTMSTEVIKGTLLGIYTMIRDNVTCKGFRVLDYLLTRHKHKA